MSNIKCFSTNLHFHAILYLQIYFYTYFMVWPMLYKVKTQVCSYVTWSTITWSYTFILFFINDHPIRTCTSIWYCLQSSIDSSKTTCFKASNSTKSADTSGLTWKITSTVLFNLSLDWANYCTTKKYCNTWCWLVTLFIKKLVNYVHTWTFTWSNTFIHSFI